MFGTVFGFLRVTASGSVIFWTVSPFTTRIRGVFECCRVNTFVLRVILKFLGASAAVFRRFLIFHRHTMRRTRCFVLVRVARYFFRSFWIRRAHRPVHPSQTAYRTAFFRSWPSNGSSSPLSVSSARRAVSTFHSVSQKPVTSAHPAERRPIG